eukprot:12018359-Alexandrium_andersonii.AAC.1
MVSRGTGLRVRGDSQFCGLLAERLGDLGEVGKGGGRCRCLVHLATVEGLRGGAGPGIRAGSAVTASGWSGAGPGRA